MWLYLKQKTNFFSDTLSILDIAPFHYFQKKCRGLSIHHYFSVDIASARVSVNADITKLPFMNNYFNCIFCYHVLEHIHNDKKAIKEINRVLKPGGFAVIQSPIDMNNEKTIEDLSLTDTYKREQLFGQRDHLRMYGKDYPEILKQGGFHVTIDNFIHQLDADLVERYCLHKNEMIYLCKKTCPC